MYLGSAATQCPEFCKASHTDHVGPPIYGIYAMMGFPRKNSSALVVKKYLSKTAHLFKCEIPGEGRGGETGVAGGRFSSDLICILPCCTSYMRQCSLKNHSYSPHKAPIHIVCHRPIFPSVRCWRMSWEWLEAEAWWEALEGGHASPALQSPPPSWRGEGGIRISGGLCPIICVVHLQVLPGVGREGLQLKRGAGQCLDRYDKPISHSPPPHS